MMVDNRPAEIRAFYKDAIYDFFYLLNKEFTEESCMPAVHLATVLLKMYSDLEACYYSKQKGPKAVNITEEKKKAARALILSYDLHSAYVSNKDPVLAHWDYRRYLIAFPGLDIRKVSLIRNQAITKWKATDKLN